MNDSQPKSMGLMALVGVVVALVVGLGIGYAVWNEDNNGTSNKNVAVSSSTKAADLRANLVNLGVQHQELTAMAVDDALDGSPGAEASKAQLIKNGQDISAAIASVYGQDAGKQFNDIWNVHLTDFVNYAVASKGGDEAAKMAALADIDANYTKPISKLLAGANPNLPENVLQGAFKEHIDMTAQMIDNHVNGDYAAEQSLLERASGHIKDLMSTLTGAIVKQYPSKFQD